MNINFNWVFDLTQSFNTKSVLAILAFFVSLVFFLFSIIKKQIIEDNLRLKIASAFLISSIAYLSENGFAYAIAIFIIATLMTKLDFIENIAGIMRNSEAWSKYKQAQMGVATPDEKKKESKQNEPESIKKEEQDIIIEENKKQMNSNDEKEVIQEDKKSELKKTSIKTFNGFVFENRTLDKLDSLRLFGEYKVNRSIKLQLKNRVLRVYDAFVRKEDTDIIIEVKLVKTKPALNYLLLQTKDYIHQLEQFNSAKERYASIKALIIIPNTDYEDTIQHNIAFLKYDIDTDEFINVEEIKNWINL